jgi:hypothetical protein
MPSYTIASINRLSEFDKRQIYTRLIPPELLDRFHINPLALTNTDSPYLVLKAPALTASVELALYHQPGFPDPLLYGHMTDTLTGQIHILLYIVNDPNSPRYPVDRLPNNRPTRFGTEQRNLEAETAALGAGLAPGQIRQGLRMLPNAIASFEDFIESIGHTLYFVEPLYYHVAVIFERYGFAYQKGRRLMERIRAGFAPGGDLLPLLDGSTPFRQPEAAGSIRMRSWAIHDNILGEPYTGVTMYKETGKSAGILTCPDCSW